MNFEKLFIENCFTNVEDMVKFIEEFDADGFLMSEDPINGNEELRKRTDAEIYMFLERVKNMCIEYLSAKKIAMHEWHDGSTILEENPDIDYSFFK